MQNLNEFFGFWMPAYAGMTFDMLTQIQIKNFAIIENLEIEFKNGFTVLTGETGAGKSILIDALQLALGGRAENHLIRAGAERCEISLSFDLKHIPAAQQWLKENDLSSDNECIIRRVISNDGRSRSSINGTTCPLQATRELGFLLVNIHGQHEHQTLLRRDKQREILDDFAKHVSLTDKVKQIYQTWCQANNELEKLHSSPQDRQAKIELLRYQVQELTELALGENEITALDQEHKKLTNAEQLITQCNQAIRIIVENDDGNVLALLYESNNHLESVKHLDNKIANAAKLINDAIIHAEEAGNELRYYLDSLELNAERLSCVEQRLSQIHQLVRKHKISSDELPALTKRLQLELEQLENADAYSKKLQQKIAQIETEYRTVAAQLTASRKQTAQKLSHSITEKMQQLSMTGGKFAIQFESVAEIHLHGLDRVEFMVSANPGQPLQALNKVASGGELSRIGLAIQVIAAQQENTATLIFDEVDVGIGGGTAEVVGKLLRTLGNKAQVLCITHLPQVAAQGHQHFQVKKQTQKNATQTDIQCLIATERVAEIARMLGGIKVTEQTILHAQEMLSLQD